jgi:hypothetical protein
MANAKRNAVIGLLIALTIVSGGKLSAALVSQDLSVVTAADLANVLVGSGVTISNVTYTGATVSAGQFTGAAGIIGFDEGVILSSGNIASIAGPNVEDGKTTDNGLPGDTDLDALSGYPTLDATVLEFDFVPDADKVFFQYVFASDEYNEYVNTQFNDVFAFFINGVNCAQTTGGLPVSVNTINNGNPFGSLPSSHPELYRNNDLQDGGGAIDTEMDGLTVVLTCEAPVIPNATNHIKLAIADGSDRILDSNVFLRAGSFSTTPPPDLGIRGRMTGGGSVRPANTGAGPARVTHGFQLNCIVSDGKNNLEVNWNGNRFHLETMTSAACSDDPAIGPHPPFAGFDVHKGKGTGRYNGEAGATAEWTLTDAGEPGRNDIMRIEIKNSGNIVVLSASGTLQSGNQQAHK